MTKCIKISHLILIITTKVLPNVMISTVSVRKGILVGQFPKVKLLSNQKQNIVFKHLIQGSFLNPSERVYEQTILSI